jgi:putative DNA primase/helicase
MSRRSKKKSFQQDGERWERERANTAKAAERVLRQQNRQKYNLTSKPYDGPSRAAIITALGGDSASGSCKCPAHEDSSPSLSVSETADGRVLVKCHAGCTQDKVIAALKSRGLWRRKEPMFSYHDHGESDEQKEYRRIREAMGLWLAAGYGRLAGDQANVAAYLRERGIAQAPACMRMVKGGHEIVMPVSSEHGPRGTHSIYLIKRNSKLMKNKDQGNKGVRSRGPIRGGYVQLADISPDEPLIVGEGVETTLSAMQLTGLPGIATLGTSGMLSVRVPPCSTVIIAADNDAPGQKAAHVLANRLEIEGREVMVVTPPFADEDWNDVLREDGNAARDVWREQSTRGGKELQAKPARWHYAEDFMEQAFPKRDMLMSPWLPNPGIAMLYAKRGEAKTYLAMAIAFAVARGEELLGWKCEKPGRVLYVDGEMPGSYLQERLAQFGKPPRDTVAIVSHDTFNLRRESMPDLGTEEGRAVLDRIIEQVKPDLVVLDSLSTLIRTGEESSAEDWAPVQAWLMTHRWRGRTMLLVHHAGKSGSQRGTSKREDTPETVIKLQKMRDTDDASADQSVYQLEFDKGRELFGLAEEPMLVKLAIRNGRTTWEHTLMRNARMDKVAQLLEAGLKQKDIAKELGITEGRVSQMVRQVKVRDDRVIPFPRKG